MERDRPEPPLRKRLEDYADWDEYFQTEIVPTFEDRRDLPPINIGYANLKRRA